MKIAFHSYKGGVGRTKVMVGVGALLAMRGYRVGMLDFDLDSSGLATIFRANAGQLGLNELLNILKLEKDRRAGIVRIKDAILDATDIVTRVFGNEPTSPGLLKYLPTVTSPTLSDDINLLKMQPTIQQLLDYVDQECGIDFLLIDVKPGYSPPFQVVLPHVKCAVFITRVDRENIVGLKQLMPRLEEAFRQEQKKFHPIIVANMVPTSDKTEERIRELGDACHHEIKVRIDYDPELLFDDDIACAADPASSMGKGLEKLADELSNMIR